MNDWLGLDGARVLVAGAGTLGSALVQGFTDVGAEVAVIDISQERLEELASATGLAGDRLVAADLSSADAAASAMGRAQHAVGGIDVFVHGVGINDRRPIGDYGPSDWDRFLAVNLSSAFFTAQVALEAMRAQGHGRVVFFSSVAGLMGHRNHGPYAATKGAINQLTKVMAHEFAADGVTVNAVAPGYMETNLTQAYLDAHPAERERLLTLIPARRFGHVEEVVGPVLFLASRHASFVTGHILYIDGGRTVV
ncbi:MAG TPA: SDR family oxidoreductase [Solirubrobacteraceae bacterium]|jgi:NAD(P)-dependent dehydrogenase (short-subunit alcohol dehydrogenase family)